MSKISLKPNASGTGVFSLEAPNSNVDRTLTLPDEAGSVLTDVSDLEPQVKTSLNATGDAPMFACRAFVNFNGNLGTVTIRESGNVSSITDNGTGDYTINFETAMPDDNYGYSVNGGGGGTHALGNIKDNGRSTGAVEVRFRRNDNNVLLDALEASVAVFR